MSDEHLMDVLTRRQKREKDGAEPLQNSGLPEPGSDYQPFSRPANQPLYTLHFVVGSDGYRSYPYVCLDPDSRWSVDGQGQVIRLRFCGSRIFDVTIRGRNLRHMFDLIHQHRIAFVMQVERGRDFTKDDEPVVTSIDIVEVKEPAAE